MYEKLDSSALSANLPGGTVTFHITDFEGLTDLLPMRDQCADLAEAQNHLGHRHRRKTSDYSHNRSHDSSYQLVPCAGSNSTRGNRRQHHCLGCLQWHRSGRYLGSWQSVGCAFTGRTPGVARRLPQRPLIVFDIWQKLDKLVELPKECCVFRDLTPEERLQFGLPVRSEAE